MKLKPQSALGSAFGSTHAVSSFKSGIAVLKELSDIGCVLFTTGSAGVELMRLASTAAKVELPAAPGEFRTAAGRTAVWLSPRSWLILCRIEDEATLAATLNELFPDRLANGVPFTDALCWFELSGPGALDCLTEGSFISLDSGGLPFRHAKRTLFAQITAVVVRQEQHTWQVAVERSRARYFVDYLTAVDETSRNAGRSAKR